MSEGWNRAPQRALLIRIGAIGNALVAVPAIRAIREAWPGAWLTLVADPVTLELIGNCPYLSETIRYDHRGPEKAGPGYARFILELRKRRFTHAVHFRRYLRSELIGLLSGAKVRVGFKTEARLQLLTRRVVYNPGENVIELNLSLARALGIPAEDRRLELWTSQGSARVKAVMAEAWGEGPLVVIHPGGATQKERLWPGFSGLAEWMQKRLSARVVLVGTLAERELLEKIAAGIKPPPAVAVGLKLSELAELIQSADLFAGTDSGPAHVADAVGVPGAVIYAPHAGLRDQLKKWKPEGKRYLAFTPPTDCAECLDYPCPLSRQKECASRITVEEVAIGLEKLYTSSQ